MKGVHEKTSRANFSFAHITTENKHIFNILVFNPI